MTTTKTVAQWAAEANGYLFRDKRADGREFLVPLDEAPQWFTDLCHAAHGDMMPDDWKYEFIQDALNSLEDDVEDRRDLGSVYPYTHDRLKWLASNLERPGYCDEAAENYGTPKDILTFIALGMTEEMTEVYDSVRNSLEELAEAEEDAAE